jgi:hypothetical protein
MEINIEAALWYLLVADCAFANVVAWFCPDWYDKSYPSIAKLFPATKSWCGVYLLITLWLGVALKRSGVLPW